MSAKSKICVFLSALWGGFIFWNSFKIGSDSTAMSGVFVDFVMGIINKLGFTVSNEFITTLIRKSGHILEFCLLAILITLVYTLSGKKIKFYSFTILFFCLATAVTDEFIQTFVQGRSGEVRDVAIDFLGSVIGVIIIALITRKRPRRLSRF